MVDRIKKKGHNGDKRHGRDLEKCAKYRSRHIREIHKVKRIRQSSGRVEALRYARDRHIEHLVLKFITN